MFRPRVIPCLLLRNGGLVKTVKFGDARYVGDPINSVRIFNEKEVDELVLLDISATPGGKAPDFRLLETISSEAFMPMSYGGGVRGLEDMRSLYSMGYEKVILNTWALSEPGLVDRAAAEFGSQSVVVSIDARRKLLGGYEVYSRAGGRRSGRDPAAWAAEVQARGAGEVILNSIDRDGTMQGYDLELVKRVCEGLTIPLVALGGAGSLEHFAGSVRAGASAVAAGSLFVFHGKHRAVLINYPERREIDACFAK